MCVWVRETEWVCVSEWESVCVCVSVCKCVEWETSKGGNELIVMIDDVRPRKLLFTLFFSFRCEWGQNNQQLRHNTTNSYYIYISSNNIIATTPDTVIFKPYENITKTCCKSFPHFCNVKKVESISGSFFKFCNFCKKI